MAAPLRLDLPDAPAAPRSARVQRPTKQLGGAPAVLASRRPDLRTEKLLLRGGVARLAAMDEVGRGALAGPVSVGVVVVTAQIGRVPNGLRDSKLLTPAAREALVTPIRRWVREYAVGHASSQEIDTVGIIGGLRLAALRALEMLDAVDAILLDGNHNYLAGACELPVHTRIKGDLTCAGVSGASVLAKTERDALMVKLADDHPEYGFAENKGYSTPEHIEALRVHGVSASHRVSWRLPGCTPLHDHPGLWSDDPDGAAEQFGESALAAGAACGMPPTSVESRSSSVAAVADGRSSSLAAVADGRSSSLAD